jgi:PncC family amidohydrolase
VDEELLDALKKINSTFRERGLTVSAAESCTGGLISHYLTALPGASDYFRAGVISYSNDVKTSVLGVSPSTISRHGAVSPETAVEMAEGVRSLAGTDFSVSSTGNLGPEVLEGKERGLVYLALSMRGKTTVRKLRLRGERSENREKASLEALRMLVEAAGEAR